MAYNSELEDGSDLNEVKIPQASRNDGLSVNPDYCVKNGGQDDCNDDVRLRALFEQVLSFFLKEVSVNKHIFRPLPPKFGHGHEADLFKLFLTIRRVGSYELVSKSGMWGFVAEECGFEIGLVASLKLIYVKYLKEFDQWLIKGGFKDEKIENLEIGVIEKLDLLSRELDGYNADGKSLTDGVIVGTEPVDDGGMLGTLELNRNGVGMNLDNDGKRSDLSPENVFKKVGFSMINDDDKRNELLRENVVKKVGFSTINDDEEQEFSVVNEVLRFHSGNDVMLAAKDVVSQKRKREEESVSFSEMLDWVTTAARDPHDVIQTSDKLWNQALLARKALFAKLRVDTSIEACGSQKKNQRMHPSMYDNDVVLVRPSSEGERCSQRAKRQRTEPGKSSMDRIPDPIESHEDRRCKLGSCYQAEVPPWTGVVSEGDSKWLGTQICPSPDHHDQTDPVAMGLQTQTSCECLFPGSADCVRFHIAEKRLKMKLELGPLFYKWRFNKMGEEVSLSWEPEEETQFQSLVIRARQAITHSRKSRQEIIDKFWKRASYSIPAKTKQDFVSYYFNVFVIRRRSYQNRVMPREIDSDDDEKVVGSVGDRFGYEKVHGLPLKCSENMQCTDLES